MIRDQKTLEALLAEAAAALATERAAHARTQGHLDDFQGTVAALDVVLLEERASHALTKDALLLLLRRFRLCTYHGGGKSTSGVHAQDKAADGSYRSRFIPATCGEPSEYRIYCDECARLDGAADLVSYEDAPAIRAALRVLGISELPEPPSY